MIVPLTALLTYEGIMFVSGYGEEWSVCSDEEGIVGEDSGGDELVGGLYGNLVSLFGVIVTA